MISGKQIRAARAIVGWKQRELAAAAGVSEISIKNAEREVVDSRGSTLNAIQQAFDRAGIIFLDTGDNPQWRPGSAAERISATSGMLVVLGSG
jgi:transcriptional regulator with XRE-family HTH domain